MGVVHPNVLRMRAAPSPAKVVRTLDDEAARRITQSADNYVANARRFATSLIKIG